VVVKDMPKGGMMFVFVVVQYGVLACPWILHAKMSFLTMHVVLVCWVVLVVRSVE